jgi:hypothetical protein
MASIFKRKNKDGMTHWRAVIRVKGYPTVCNILPVSRKLTTGQTMWKDRSSKDNSISASIRISTLSKIGLRTLEEPSISQEVVIQYRQIVKTLLNLRQTKDKQQLRSLKLSVEAYQKWKEYAKLIEKLMGEEIGKLTHMTDWAGKLAGAIGRIAGLIHCMRYANSNPMGYEISFNDMHAAVKIGHCLTNHVVAVFDLLHKMEAVPHRKAAYKLD